MTDTFTIPRQVVLVTAGLGLAVFALGLITGSRWANVSESDAIEVWAEVYTEETGGKPTDCAAVPAREEEIWLIVRCGSGPGARVYPLDRMGRLVVPSDGGPST